MALRGPLAGRIVSPAGQSAAMRLVRVMTGGVPLTPPSA